MHKKPPWSPFWPLPLAVRRDADLLDMIALDDLAHGRLGPGGRERLHKALLAAAVLAEGGVGAEHAELLQRAAELQDAPTVAEALQVVAALRAAVSWGRLRQAHEEAVRRMRAARLR